MGLTICSLIIITIIIIIFLFGLLILGRCCVWAAGG